MTKIDKFKPSKEKKAYSYFGTICKNYLMGQIIKDQKETNRKISYEDISYDLENNLRPDLIYYIDNERILQNTNISILKYINNNIDKLDNWIQNCNFDSNFYINFKNYYDKKNLETDYKLISEIGIISNNNIDLIKNIFKNCIEKITYNYELKYISTPYYSFETSSEDSTENDHYLFIQNLKNQGKIYKDVIFINIKYIAKKFI
jgi:hypothetical protein